MRRRILGWVALAATWALAAPARAGERGVAEHRLENGLTVLLRPVSGATQAAVVVLFRVGEAHDLDPALPAPAPGVGHLLEHLYVTAAAGPLPARTALDWVRARPAGWNAQTSWDHTVIAEVVPAQDLPSALDEAAARMGDLKIAASDLARELPRMAEEAATMGAGALGTVNAARARLRGAGRPVGGRVEALRSLPWEAVAARAALLYRPSNAVLVLAGALGEDPLAAVKARFAGWPPGTAAPAPAPLAPPSPPGPPTRLPVKDVTSRAPRGGVGVAIPLRPVAREGTLDEVALAQQVVVGRLHERMGELDPPTDRWGGLPATGAFPPTVWCAPLDAPGELVLWTPLREGETPDAALARVEVLLRRAAEAPIAAADLWRWTQAYGFLYGLVDPPDAAVRGNLYGLAYGLGRRHMLGIDPSALRQVPVATLEAARPRAFAPEPGAYPAVVHAGSAPAPSPGK